MNSQTVLTLAQQALWVTGLVAAPLLLTALAVGLAVSVFQAATQINEASLSFIPKLLAMFVVLVVCGPWMLSILVDYIQRLFQSIPQTIG
jgi:flagellar biosynthetic protein FliQ